MVTRQQQLSKFEKALAKAAETFKTVDLSTVTLPTESASDILREAASVLAYFDMKEKFRDEICRYCNQPFKYAYYMTAVKCCSVACMAGILERMGLAWDPSAPLERRWGRYVPAIVPAIVAELLPKDEPAPPTQGPVQVEDDIAALLTRLLT